MTTITRAAQSRPRSVNEAERTVELVIATDAPIDGLSLSLDRMPAHGPGPVPVLLSHENKTAAMAGRLEGLRIERGRPSLLIGTARFTDAPAADEGWKLARSGSNVSVGADVEPDSIQRSGNHDTATSWRIHEASLVPVGADHLAVTRSQSLETTPVTDSTQTTEQPAELTREQRKAEKVELAIRRAAAYTKLDESTIQRIIEEHRGDQEAATIALVRAHRLEVERTAPVCAGGSPIFERGGVFGGGDEANDLKHVLHRAMSGERQDQPLWLTLRAAGIGKGNDPVSVWRTALTGEGRWLTRGGSLSTSDLPNLLTASGNRRLLERFAVADAGIRFAATVRPLADFRAASTLDVGLVGTAKKILEGGEITFGSVAESATSYKPTRHGLGLSFTPESLANDDLAALDLALAELAASMLDAEAAALVDLIEGAANGRNAPDGQAIFHSSHTNTVSAGPLGIASIGTAVQKLREQKALGGRYIAQDPAVLLVGTAHETSARQLLSSAINAAQSEDVNPWRNLEIAVEPRLSGTYAYILGNSRRPLELGRLTDAPVLTTETQFETGAYRAKAEHSFGVGIAEFRSIVRIPTAA
jgi:hypothetical protein